MTRLALIKGAAILQLVTAGRGFFLPNEKAHVSPAVDGWDNGTYRLAAVAEADDVPDGKQVVSSSIEMVSGAPKWVRLLEDIPLVPMLPMVRQTFFKAAFVEFALTRDELRTLAGNVGAAYPPEGLSADQGRELALIDYDEADDVNRSHPLTLAIMAVKSISVEAMDAAWRKWQVIS